ncbi:MAG: hypothetical protein M1840_001561 [Geoglossum simile]|nr:MAG: hypothetical protein M1840_001561 [Geoglossum simile]
MSDIQMNDAQMSVAAAFGNQMTTANTMHTSQSNLQANTASIDDDGHGLAEAFGSRLSLEDTDTHMSGATDNAVHASTADAGDVQISSGDVEMSGATDSGIQDSAANVSSIQQNIAEASDIQASGAGESGATDNAVHASTADAGDVRQSVAEAFGTQISSGDVQMSGATDSGIQDSAANVSSIQQNIAEASDIQASSAGESGDGDQVGNFSATEIEQALYEAFDTEEEAVSDAQASAVDAGGIQESAAEASNIQSAWEIDADDIQQSTREVDGGDATVENAGSQSQPKDAKKSRSTRRQIKKREEKKREGVFSGGKSWKQVKAEKAERRERAERVAQFERAAGLQNEVTGEASQPAGRGGRGGRGGSRGGHAGHGTVPSHLVAPPRIPQSPHLKGNFRFTTSCYTSPAAATAAPTSASPATPPVLPTASPALATPPVLPAASPVLATPPVLPADSPVLPAVSPRAKPPVLPAALRPILRARPPVRRAAPSPAPATPSPPAPAAQRPSPSTPVRSDPLQLFPARTAKLPPVSLSPVAHRPHVPYEDLLLEVQQYRHGLEEETDKNRKLRISYATLNKKHIQAEKDIKSLQTRYNEVHEENVKFQESQQDLRQKQSEWTLETSASDPQDVATQLAGAIAKVASLEISLAVAKEVAIDEKELAIEELQGGFTAALTAEREKYQQLKEEQSSASAEYNKAREDSLRLSAELTESQRGWTAEYQALGERLTGEINSLQQRLVQTTAAFEEDQRQLIAQRDGVQGQLIAEREQSRATFEEDKRQLIAQRDGVQGQLIAEREQSRAAFEEDKRQLIAQRDGVQGQLIAEREQSRAAFEEDKRQLIAQRDGVQGQLIAEREQSRAAFEEDKRQLIAQRDGVQGQLIAEREQSRAAFEEDKRQLIAQRDGQLIAEREQSRAAFEEDKRQLIAQRDGQLIAEREQSRATLEDALAQLNAEREKANYHQQQSDLSRAAYEESQGLLSAQQEKFHQNQDEWRKAFEAQRVELEGRIQSAEEAAQSKFKAQRVELEGRIQSAEEAAQSKFKAQRVELEGRIQSAEEAAQSKGRCDQLEQESAAMQSLADQLKDQVAQLLDELRHTREDADAATARRGKEVSELSEQLSQREVELEGFRVRALEWQALEKSLGEFKRDGDERLRRLRVELEEQIREMEEECDRLRELIAQKERELRGLDAKIAAFAIEKGTDDREKADLKRAVANAEAATSRYEKTAANLRRQLADARKEVNDAQSQLRDDGAIIQDLKRKVSSLERGAGNNPDATPRAASLERPVVNIPPLNSKVEDQEVEVEVESAKESTSLVGAALPKPVDPYDDEKELVLAELLNSQDPFLRAFRDRNGLDKPKTMTAGRPDGATMTYSLLNGKPHLSDEDLVRRYSRTHPGVLFRSLGDETSFRDLVGQVRNGRLSDEATIELDNLMARQSPAVKAVYQISRIAGSDGFGHRTIIKEVAVEKEVFVEKRVFVEKPAVAETAVEKKPEQVAETAEITVAGRVGTTRWWRTIPTIFMIFIAVFLVFCGYVLSNLTINDPHRPWQHNDPLPWRIVRYLNGGVPPKWAQYLQYWAITTFEQGLPF